VSLTFPQLSRVNPFHPLNLIYTNHHSHRIEDRRDPKAHCESRKEAYEAAKETLKIYDQSLFRSSGGRQKLVDHIDNLRIDANSAHQAYYGEKGP
jgi:hypothetical protein